VCHSLGRFPNSFATRKMLKRFTETSLHHIQLGLQCLHIRKHIT
jgi:hypothetical protein